MSDDGDNHGPRPLGYRNLATEDPERRLNEAVCAAVMTIWLVTVPVFVVAWSYAWGTHIQRIERTGDYSGPKSARYHFLIIDLPCFAISAANLIASVGATAAAHKFHRLAWLLFLPLLLLVWIVVFFYIAMGPSWTVFPD